LKRAKNAVSRRTRYRRVNIVNAYRATCRIETSIKIAAKTKVRRKISFSKPRRVNDAVDPLPNPVPRA
jgi:hypothetical protein